MGTPLTVFVALVLGLCASAQTLVRSVNGPSANAQYGKACVVVPDQNGDGVKDLLVGAPGFTLSAARSCASPVRSSQPARARRPCGRSRRPPTKATASAGAQVRVREQRS
jgi:hypothetical protein